MKCPNCGTTSKFDFSYCPCCGYKLTLELEQPLPNWRRLPGFRSGKLWKMLLAVIVYTVILLSIIASSFIIWM